MKTAVRECICACVGVCVCVCALARVCDGDGVKYACMCTYECMCVPVCNSADDRTGLKKKKKKNILRALGVYVVIRVCTIRLINAEWFHCHAFDFVQSRCSVGEKIVINEILYTITFY